MKINLSKLRRQYRDKIRNDRISEIRQIRAWLSENGKAFTRCKVVARWYRRKGFEVYHPQNGLIHNGWTISL